MSNRVTTFFVPSLLLAAALLVLPLLSSCVTTSAGGAGSGLAALSTQTSGSYTRVSSSDRAELVVQPGESLPMAELEGPGSVGAVVPLAFGDIVQDVTGTIDAALRLPDDPRIRWVKIEHGSGSKPTYVCTFYLPPVGGPSAFSS